MGRSHRKTAGLPQNKDFPFTQSAVNVQRLCVGVAVFVVCRAAALLKPRHAHSQIMTRHSGSSYSLGHCHQVGSVSSTYAA